MNLPEPPPGECAERIRKMQEAREVEWRAAWELYWQRMLVPGFRSADSSG